MGKTGKYYSNCAKLDAFTLSRWRLICHTNCCGVHYHGYDDMLLRRDTRKLYSELFNKFRLILKKEYAGPDEQTGKYTYGFLFEKQGS